LLYQRYSACGKGYVPPMYAAGCTNFIGLKVATVFFGVFWTSWLTTLVSLLFREVLIAVIRFSYDLIIPIMHVLPVAAVP
jgi:hypothetical protein